ncbi:MAG: helix-turn-helix transcriptional regulator, partial [Deltaproteobacteria bacterium]|nr:helix-turn-helix transcriptional regulator [Deltaproteobacteria bacterium]
MTAPTESLGKTGSVRSGRAAKTRGKLLDATAELLAERGYSRLSTAAVAERAGVAHGTLFKHFPTKSALMAATTERVLED